MSAHNRQASSGFWWVTLATFLVLAATAFLGRWQLERAAQKQALQDAVQQRAALAPITSTQLAQALQGGALLPEDWRHRRVQLRGHWRAEYTVYLDNRPMQGRAGFFVLTPLQLEDSAQLVLVERGWIARDVRDRTYLAPVSTPSGVVEVLGRWAGEPARLLELQAAPAGSGTSRIRQNLDMAAFAQETGLALAPWSVLQTEGPPDGLQRHWPAFTAGVEKHHGYAFQWFGLSGLVALLYVWFQLVPRFVPRRRAL